MPVYLPPNASRARIIEAESARENGREIIRERSWGRVSRRDLFKWGLFASAGLLAPINGLNPFIPRVFADDGNIPRSPLFGVQPFTQPMSRFDVLARNAVSTLNPLPTAEANQTQQIVDPKLGGGTGPIEGRPPGSVWANQRFADYVPRVAVEATQAPATTNLTYNPAVPSSLNSGINAAAPMELKFHPQWPTQDPGSVWTFNGTIPPKLLQARYGEPVLFRHHNGLPVDVTLNGGFGIHTISTHEHNGHHGAENDGFTGAFFFSNQVYDIFNSDGFLGDVMTVNYAYKPYIEVERRRYRFRILNGSVARFFKIALANAAAVAQPMIQIANDGNLLPNPVVLTALDEQGIAERYDVVIDFSGYRIDEKLYLVNLTEHEDGTGPERDLTVADTFAGRSSDPCVGRFLEFRVVRDPARLDQSRELHATDILIPNPDLSQAPCVRERTFVFGDDAQQTTFDPVTSFSGPWGIAAGEDAKTLAPDFGRILPAPRYGTREIWHLVNDGGGWDHPIHVHFEEGRILARNRSASRVPPWERGRKDVYRRHPGGRALASGLRPGFHRQLPVGRELLSQRDADDAGGPQRALLRRSDFF